MRPLRALWTLLAGVAVVLILAGPAAAAGGESGDCRSEPIPEAPGRGITGWVNAAPKPLPDGAKFTREGVPRFEQYGFAGMRWNAYDLGCGGDWVRAPDAMIGTMLANWTFEGSKFGVGLTDSVTGAAYHPTFLNVFDPLIRNAVDTLQNVLFNRWVGVFIALAAIVLLYKATRLRFATAAVVLGWALLVMAAATVIFTWPIKAGSFVDGAVGSVAGGVHRGINNDASSDPATTASQSAYYAVLWNQWKVGEFGTTDSAVADKYAQPLFDSQSLTWREARIVENDPDGEGQELLDAKQDKFYDTADQIKEEDPDAYLYVTGKKAESRVGAALFALVAAACVLPLLFMSAVLIIASYIIVRLAVMLFPAIATIGVAYSFRGLVTGVASVVAAAVINTIVFAVGAAINLLAISVLLSPTSRLPAWLGLLLAALTAIVMWVALKPFRRLTKMANPNQNVLGDTADTLRSAGSKTAGLVKSVGIGAATGGVAGAAAGAVITDDDDDKAAGEATRQRTEGYSAPEPAPAPAVAASSAPTPAALPPGAAAPTPEPTAAPQTPVGPTPAVPAPPAPVGPVALPQAPHIYGAPPAIGATATPDSGAAPEVGEVPAPPHEPQPEGWPMPAPHVVTTPDPGMHPDLSAGDDTPDTAGTTGAGTPVGEGTRPESNLDDGGGVYYTPEGQSVPGPANEPDMFEPELDDEGSEAYAFYNPPAGEREDVQ